MHPEVEKQWFKKKGTDQNCFQCTKKLLILNLQLIMQIIAHLRQEHHLWGFKGFITSSIRTKLIHFLNNFARKTKKTFENGSALIKNTKNSHAPYREQFK